jgi:CAAX prenyl protease-like protein
MAAALPDLDVKTLQRFFGSISVFGVFYLAVTILVFRWDQILGPASAKYAGVFVIDWYLLTATVLIFLMTMLGLGILSFSGQRGRAQEFIRRTAIVVNVWDGLAAILAILLVVGVLVLILYVARVVFPLTVDELAVLVPVLAIAAASETLAFQWFLTRAFESQWPRLGFLWGAIVFAEAHANLTILSFVVLVMLGVFFYYLTNPAGNLPFWVNVVFSTGIHVIYNVFVFAYRGPQGFLLSHAQGLTGPTLVFWAVMGLVLVVVVYGALRVRVGRRASA